MTNCALPSRQWNLPIPAESEAGPPGTARDSVFLESMSQRTVVHPEQSRGMLFHTSYLTGSFHWAMTVGPHRSAGLAEPLKHLAASAHSLLTVCTMTYSNTQSTVFRIPDASGETRLYA